MLFTSLLIAMAAPALAAITPTSPDASTVVKVGSNIDAQWSADETGTWTNTTIQLMTGANLNMTALATVASGIDGKTTTSFSFPAPDVSPYSKIYFLQFTNGGDVTTATWTTRFTIAGADGSTTEPTESTTTDGNTVQWGNGKLVGTVTAVDGANGSPSSAAAAASGSSTDSDSASSASTAGAAAVSSATASSAASAAVSAASAAASKATSATSAAASATHASAASPKAAVGLGALVLAVAGVVAL